MNTQTHQATHTPGPWKCAQSLHGDFVIAADSSSIFNHVATIPIFNGMAHGGASVPCRPDSAQANAHIIALAPAMFAALSEIANSYGVASDVDTVIKFREIARAAIARAQGGAL